MSEVCQIKKAPERYTNPNEKVKEAEESANAAIPSGHYGESTIHQHLVALERVSRIRASNEAGKHSSLVRLVGGKSDFKWNDLRQSIAVKWHRTLASVEADQKHLQIRAQGSVCAASSGRAWRVTE